MKDRNHRSSAQVLSTATAIGSLLLSASCSTRLARENVFANTESAFGLTIAENPQTQIYELKLGYARHEVFYVPTSKLVFYEKGGGKGKEAAPGGVSSYNDPSTTPDVLADIQIGGSGKSKEGAFTLRQRLAVGKNAVNAPAAASLLMDDSAAGKEMAFIATDPKIVKQREDVDALLKKKLKPDATCGARKGSEFKSTDEFAECLANEVAPGKTLAFVRFFGGENLEKLTKRLNESVE